MNILIIFTAKYLLFLSGALYLFYAFSLFKSDKKRFNHFIVLSIISFPLIYLVAKLSGMVISDPRPFMVTHIKPLITSSIDNGFPSDHTLLSMALASVVWLFNRKLGLILVVFALLIGTARVLAGVHHPLDIIGSIIIAVVITTLVFETAKFVKI